MLPVNTESLAEGLVLADMFGIEVGVGVGIGIGVGVGVGVGEWGIGWVWRRVGGT